MKVTVGIPTISGREKYLESCLRTCTEQDEDYEILVSDNPGGGARDIVASIRDPRIRYVTPPRYLPMSAHWDFLLTQVSGDLLTIIGDDDGLMPGCIKRVKEIQSQANGLPIQHSLINYWWGDVAEVARRRMAWVMHPVGWDTRVESSPDFIRSIARARGRYEDGPMVYHNFIPVELLRRLTVQGVFFRRSSPDVYSGLAIAAATDAFLVTHELLTLSGQGARANGAAVRAGGAQQFMAETQSLYPPRFGGRTVHLMVLDCLMEIAEHTKQPELLSDLSLSAHLAAAFRETQGMGKAERRIVVDEIRARGLFVKTVAARTASIIRGRMNGRPAKPPGRAFDRGESIKTTALNIYDATLELKARLDSLKPA